MNFEFKKKKVSDYIAKFKMLFHNQRPPMIVKFTYTIHNMWVWLVSMLKSIKYNCMWCSLSLTCWTSLSSTNKTEITKIIGLFLFARIISCTVLKMRIWINWSESNNGILFLYISKYKLKNLLVLGQRTGAHHEECCRQN